MMKQMFFAFCFSFFSFQVIAEPIGDLRFEAKVISFDSKTARIEVEGKKYFVPRTALKGEPSSGKVHEVSLTEEQYQEMTAQSKSTNSK